MPFDSFNAVADLTGFSSMQMYTQFVKTNKSGRIEEVVV